MSESEFLFDAKNTFVTLHIVGFAGKSICGVSESPVKRMHYKTFNCCDNGRSTTELLLSKHFYSMKVGLDVDIFLFSQVLIALDILLILWKDF